MAHIFIPLPPPPRPVLQIPEFSEEKYMMVVTKVNTTEVDEFRDICTYWCMTSPAVTHT